MSKLFLENVLLSIILAFIFIISSFIFNEIFIIKNSDYIVSGLSAFMGAFFAFIFIRIADFLNIFYIRKKCNHNALVRLEQTCNNNLCIVGENLEQLGQFRKALSRKSLFAGVLQSLLIDKTVLLDLININLVNDVFTFNTETRKLNESTKMLEAQYEKIEKCLLSGVKIGEIFYEKNAPLLLSLIGTLRKFYSNFDNKNIELLSKVRIFLKDKPLIIEIMSYFNQKQLDDNQVLDEIKIVKKEMAESIKKSLKEIKEANES